MKNSLWAPATLKNKAILMGLLISIDNYMVQPLQSQANSSVTIFAETKYSWKV